MFDINFELPESLYKSLELEKRRLENLGCNLEKIANQAGTNSAVFKESLKKIKLAIQERQQLTDVIRSRRDVRALAFLLLQLHIPIPLNKSLIDTMDKAMDNYPTNMIFEQFLQYYFIHFNKLSSLDIFANWLCDTKRALEKRTNRNIQIPEKLLNPNGTKWLAIEAIKQRDEFNVIVNQYGLHKYAEGCFMQVAKSHYYIEQLKSVDLNEDNRLFDELKKEEVYNSRFDDKHKIGHQTLLILLQRTWNSRQALSDACLDVILTIAGDPRISRINPKYRNWWQYIDRRLQDLVISRLSRKDLQLFLDAVEDYGISNYNYMLQEMFPSRKRFLEGLLEKGFIKSTRLYLSRGAEQYLLKNYQKDTFPSYATVASGDKTLIFIDLGNIQIIEGSHQISLWIYKNLSRKACVYNYDINRVLATDLTQGLSRRMKAVDNCQLIAKITHTSDRLKWQKETLQALNNNGIDINPQDVLSSNDYQWFKQIYGATGWRY